MKTTSRAYLRHIDYLPHYSAISMIFFWILTKEGESFWSDADYESGRRGKRSSKVARKLRQLRKTAFRCGYRNKFKNWRA